MASSANGTARNASPSASGAACGSGGGISATRNLTPAPYHALVSAWTRRFRLALTDWVNDFLFATDSATCAAQLLSPLQSMYAQPMTTMSRMNSGDVVAHHLLYLPTFSVANITVGHVVVEELSGGVRELRKYCLDDDTGAMLCIGTARDTMEVEYVQYNTTFSSRRTILYFAPEMRTYLRSRKAKASVDDNVVRSLLQVCVILDESRASCIQCSALSVVDGPSGGGGGGVVEGPATLNPCSCRFHFQRARHALDFEHTARNTVPLLGDFRGYGPTVTFQNGRIKTVPTLTELFVRAGGTPGLFERLQSWAVQMYYAEGKPNPIMLEMPPVGGMDMDLEAVKLADSFLKLDTEPTVQATDVKALARSNTDIDIDEILGTVQLSNEEFNHKLNISPTPPLVPLVKSNISPSPSSTPPPLVPLVPVPNVAAVGASMPLTSTWNTNRVNVQQQHQHPNVVPGHIIIRPVPQAAHGGNIVPVYANGPSGVLPMPAVVPTQRLAVGKRVIKAKRTLTTIAPSAVPPAAGEQYNSMERRKIMKREAAARSNAKRREVVALQRQLKKVQQKVAKLRDRQHQLQEENARLHALTHQS